MDTRRSKQTLEGIVHGIGIRFDPQKKPDFATDAVDIINTEKTQKEKKSFFSFSQYQSTIHEQKHVCQHLVSHICQNEDQEKKYLSLTK